MQHFQNKVISSIVLERAKYKLSIVRNTISEKRNLNLMRKIIQE